MSGEDAALMWTGLATNATIKQSSVSDMDQEDIGSFSDMVATYFDRLPDHDDPVLLAFLAAFCAGVLVSLIVVGVMRRKQATSVSSEPLLGA